MAIRGFLNIAYARDVNLSIPFGISFDVINTQRATSFDTCTESGGMVTAAPIALEIGIRNEWFVNDFFAIHGSPGIVLYIIPEHGRATATPQPTTADGVDLPLFTASELLGSHGMTFWFP